MNKSQIYDEKISPLMKDIVEICRRNDIEMVAVFGVETPSEPDLVCSSAVHSVIGARNPVIECFIRVVQSSIRRTVQGGMMSAVLPSAKKNHQL